MARAEAGRPRSGNLIRAGSRTGVLWPHEGPRAQSRMRGEQGSGAGWERPAEHRRRLGFSTPAQGSGLNPSLPPSQLTGQGPCSMQGPGTETQQGVLTSGDPPPGRTPASPKLPWNLACPSSSPPTPAPCFPAGGLVRKPQSNGQGRGLWGHTCLLSTCYVSGLRLVL